MHPEIDPGLIISGETRVEEEAVFDPKKPVLNYETDVVYKVDNNGGGTNRYFFKKQIRSFACHRCNQIKDIKSLGVRHQSDRKKEVTETYTDGRCVKTIASEEELYCKWCSFLLSITAPFKDIRNGGTHENTVRQPITQ